MSDLPTLGEALNLNARLFPDKIGARDLERSMTFRLWNQRAARLANALIGIGIAKGDRVAVLAYNCVEWLEIYAACAKAGVVAVPINFRLVGAEIAFIVANCGAKAMIVQHDLLGAIEESRRDVAVQVRNFIHFGAAACPAGYLAYEGLLAAARDDEPSVAVNADEPWTLMYTSGTTGNPKGAIRSHRGSALLSLATDVEMGFGRNDSALLVMPMCHANSLFFYGAFSYCGAACTVYSRRSFDPEHLLRTLAEGGASFTSLVPTHYIMMLGLSERVRAAHNVDRVTKLWCPRRRRAATPSSRSSTTSVIPGCSNSTDRLRPDG